MKKISGVMIFIVLLISSCQFISAQSIIAELPEENLQRGVVICCGDYDEMTEVRYGHSITWDSECDDHPEYNCHIEITETLLENVTYCGNCGAIIEKHGFDIRVTQKHILLL